MKYATLFPLIVSACVAISHGQQTTEKIYPMVTLDVLVKDDGGNPIRGAHINGGDDLENGNDQATFQEGDSDATGHCRLRFRALGLVGILSQKKGWYESNTKNNSIKFSPFEYRKDIPEREQQDPPFKKEVSLQGAVTMRKIIKPIPLCAKHVSMDIPEKMSGWDMICRWATGCRPTERESRRISASARTQKRETLQRNRNCFPVLPLWKWILVMTGEFSQSRKRTVGLHTVI